MKRFSAVALASVLTLALAVPALSQAAAHGGKSAAAAASASKEHSSHKAKSAAHKEKIDINSASKEQLMALPGIDDATADKIIAARPFKTKAQLLQKSIVTKAEYSKVSGHVIARMAGKAAPESKAPESTPESQGQSDQQSTPESK